MALEKATFGAGCFWGIEETFRKISGVTDVAVGYEGGTKENPSYENVCDGNTGHAEVVEIDFDSQKVTYADLLKTFWKIHDPTQLHRQGPDVGYQYRSVIFYHSPEQKKIAKESLAEEEGSGRHDGEIVTQIEPAKTFWRAEEYHQRYFEKNGGGVCHI